MDMLNHDFYVFRNDEDGQVNVVYRRRDGDYGLIAPEALRRDPPCPGAQPGPAGADEACATMIRVVPTTSRARP